MDVIIFPRIQSWDVMGIKPQESNEAELLRFVVLSKHYEFCIFIFTIKQKIMKMLFCFSYSKRTDN